MKICITGLIGSGKTSVLDILRRYTSNVFSCDEINDQLLSDESYLKVLAQNFGEDIIVDGVLDKKALAKIIFLNEDKRLLLNKLSHPEITKKLIELINDKSGDIFIEIPLLAESNLATLFDKIWLVESDYEVRIDRIIKRDNISHSLALAKINSQAKNESMLKSVATDTIHNNNDQTFLELQIKTLLQSLDE